MKKVVRDVLCMSGVRGNKVRVQKNLPFSFYFGAQQGEHSIRVKPMFSPVRLEDTQVGTLELCDDWAYTPGPDDSAVSAKDVGKMKKFFRTYLVLFAAVWDRQLDDGDVYDYLVGDITLPELIEQFDFYDTYKEALDDVVSVLELEQFCRRHDLVNLYDN